MLYIAGSFDQVGGITAYNIARLDLTTNAWSALGCGITRTGASVRTDHVKALAIQPAGLPNPGLYATGGIARAGCIPSVGLCCMVWCRASGNGWWAGTHSNSCIGRRGDRGKRLAIPSIDPIMEITTAWVWHQKRVQSKLNYSDGPNLMYRAFDRAMADLLMAHTLQSNPKIQASKTGNAQLNSMQLLEGCRRRSADGSHERFCFELFRRALVDDDQSCWDAIYGQYQNLIHGWILKVTSGHYAVGIMTIEDIGQDARRAFKRSYTAEKLALADGVGSVLKYLKSTVISATQLAQQKASKELLQDEWVSEVVDMHRGESPEHQSPESAVLGAMESDALWQVIDDACHDEREQLVARLSFVSNLTPRRMMALHPDVFDDEESIYKLRKNLVKRLRRNAQLLELLER